MVLLIHDLKGKEGEHLVSSYPKEPTVIADNGTIRHCLGCFGCWVKTPGICVIRDDYGNMGGLLGGSVEVHVVSKCIYGSYSPFVKSVLDRSISYIHPDFVIRKGETHHRLRYDRPYNLTVWFYGQGLGVEEKKTARKLVESNALNMGCIIEDVVFVESAWEIITQRCERCE